MLRPPRTRGTVLTDRRPGRSRVLLLAALTAGAGIISAVAAEPGQAAGYERIDDHLGESISRDGVKAGGLGLSDDALVAIRATPLRRLERVLSRCRLQTSTSRNWGRAKRTARRPY